MTTYSMASASMMTASASPADSPATFSSTALTRACARVGHVSGKASKVRKVRGAALAAHSRMDRHRHMRVLYLQPSVICTCTWTCVCNVPKHIHTPAPMHTHTHTHTHTHIHPHAPWCSWRH